MYGLCDLCLSRNQSSRRTSETFVCINLLLPALQTFYCVFLQEPRPHNFKTAQFYHPTFCSHCGSMIYGLINQGVRCNDCGMTAHHRCQKQVPRACGTDHQEKRGRINLAYYSEKLNDTTWRINIEGKSVLTDALYCLHCQHCVDDCHY